MLPRESKGAYQVDAMEAGRVIGKYAAGGAVTGAILAAIVTDGEFRFGVAQLAKRTRCEYHCAWRCVQQLRDLGLITVESQPDRTYIVRAGEGLEK